MRERKGVHRTTVKARGVRRFPLQIGGVGGGPAARSAAGNLSNRLLYPFGRVFAYQAVQLCRDTWSRAQR